MDKNSITFIQLPKIIIKKEDFTNIINDYDKIEISKSLNKNLKDVTVMKFRPYTTFPQSDFFQIIGFLKVLDSELKSKESFISGIISSKGINMISHKSIKKLIQLEIEHNFTLPISKSTRTKFNELNKIQ